jgi:hypothetical protein
MLTLATLLAWGLTVYRGASNRRTAFFDSLDVNAELSAAISTLDGARIVNREERFCEFSNRDGYILERYALKMDQSQYDEFMDALKLRIRDRIDAAGCTDDFQTGRLKKDFEGESFVTGYQHNWTVGKVVAILDRPVGDQITLTILVHEGGEPSKALSPKKK